MVNGVAMLTEVHVPGEDKGRTTTQVELQRQQVGPENTVTVCLRANSSILFLGYCEIELVAPPPPM